MKIHDKIPNQENIYSTTSNEANIAPELDEVEELPEEGHVVLEEGQEELLAEENDAQLDAELHKAATRRTLFLSEHYIVKILFLFLLNQTKVELKGL